MRPAAAGRPGLSSLLPFGCQDAPHARPTRLNHARLAPVARIQKFTVHHGGAYIWLPPELRRHMKLIKGDYIEVRALARARIAIRRLTTRSYAAPRTGLPPA